MTLGNEELLARACVPTAAIRPVDLLPALRSLDEALVTAAIEAVGREGKTVSCRAHCGACCRQLVPISGTEARYLTEVVRDFPDEPRTRFLQRFRDAYERLQTCGLMGPLRASAHLKDRHALTQLADDYFALQIACPFLEDESCSIHVHRPLSCLEYLVTTPAEWCRSPKSHLIERVPLYAKPSQTLYRFDDGEGRGEVFWLPLVLGLEWAVVQGPETEPRRPGERMFRSFLERLAERER